jgi:tRNA(Ile)-lysidine synthase
VEDHDLSAAVAPVPAGAWAVGVSGGADSVALLLLLRRYRPDLSLELVHLNHETRGAESEADAEFVSHLAVSTGVPFVVGRWTGTEPMLQVPPKNLQARFRAGRMALFRHAVTRDRLSGVILAHHADDVAETILQRLLRGSGPTGLAGIRFQASVGDLLVLRPLLDVRRDRLRAFLRETGQPWREDASNVSPRYQRNRLRVLLQRRPGLTEKLLNLARACRDLKDWTARHVPATTARLPVGVVRDLPAPLAAEASRQWLRASGVPAASLDAPVLNRLVEMATDAASPARRHFPGGVLVRRRAGVLFVEAASGPDGVGR